MTVELGQYKKLGYKRPNIKVLDEEINEYLNHFRVQYEVELELTDDIVRGIKINGVNNLHDLIEYAKNKIYYDKLLIESTSIVNKIMHKIIGNSKVDLKDEDIEHLKYEILADFKKQLKKENVNLGIYLSYTKKTEEELLGHCKHEAETYLIEKAIIEEIAKVENITLNNEERLAHNEKQDVVNQLLYQKVIRFLIKENTKQYYKLI